MNNSVSGFLSLLLIFSVLVFFVACGSSSNDRIIMRGKVLEEVAITRTDGDSIETSQVSVAGAVVSALGSTDITDTGGNFIISGDATNIPAETLVTITFPDSTRSHLQAQVTVNTSGDFGGNPFNVTVVKNMDGSYSVTALGGDSTEVESGSNIDNSGDTIDDTSAPDTIDDTTEVVDETPTDIVDDTANDIVDDTTSNEGPMTSSFMCTDGTYTSTGNGCGLTAVEISSNDGASVTVGGFEGSDGALFAITTDNVATGSGLTVFSIGDHTCTLTCTPTTSMTMNCTNDQGGSCTQSFSK
ncbi:MAG: hypothetical protein R3A13_09500 [Bdellovibrionota bacterium]